MASKRKNQRIGLFTGNATGVEFSIPSGAASIHVHGTFTATITIQGSNFPRGTNTEMTGYTNVSAAWDNVSGAITSSGFFALYEPVTAIRAVCSGHSAGTVYVDVAYDDEREE